MDNFLNPSSLANQAIPPSSRPLQTNQQIGQNTPQKSGIPLPLLQQIPTSQTAFGNIISKKHIIESGTLAKTGSDRLFKDYVDASRRGEFGMFRTIVNNMESVEYDIDDSRRGLFKKGGIHIEDDQDRDRMIFGKNSIKDVLKQVMMNDAKRRPTLKQASMDFSTSLYGGSSQLVNNHKRKPGGNSFVGFPTPSQQYNPYQSIQIESGHKAPLTVQNLKQKYYATKAQSFIGNAMRRSKGNSDEAKYGNILGKLAPIQEMKIKVVKENSRSPEHNEYGSITQSPTRFNNNSNISTIDMPNLKSLSPEKSQFKTPQKTLLITSHSNEGLKQQVSKILDQGSIKIRQRASQALKTDIHGKNKHHIQQSEDNTYSGAFHSIVHSKQNQSKIGGEYAYLNQKYIPQVKPCLQLNTLPDQEEDDYGSPSPYQRDSHILFGETQYEDSFKQSCVKSSKKVVQSSLQNYQQEQEYLTMHAELVRQADIQKRLIEDIRKESNNTQGRESLDTVGSGEQRTLPPILKQGSITKKAAKRKMFRIPPIPTDSERNQVELKWLKKANPHFYQNLKKQDETNFGILVKKRDHLRQQNDILMNRISLKQL
ncbi:hypothetical protein FGO68_gene4835 [Halteria grandinella]|uniref:Uncharacterized protein n=1 Tax=Halteria grandinella TaxID=5974 RepID=A0A8J8NST8_HALGN|nr:hypothetical protein FGO68_gene4835 [Halteria grandinella]